MRLTWTWAIILAASAAACTRMEQFYPGSEIVMIDGEEFAVRQQGEANYQAVPNDVRPYNTMTLDARAAPKNIRAIEKHTGCKVIAESIQNRGVHTVAAVAC